MGFQEECKPLAGHRVGISIAVPDGPHMSSHGVDEREINRVVRSLSQILLAQGARLVFGHDWRPDGVMTEVLQLAQSYRTLADESTGNEQEDALITGCVAWPDEPVADVSILQRLRGVLFVARTGRPDEIDDLPSEMAENAYRKDPVCKAYLRARSLTQMRHWLTQHSTSRVCLGGKLGGSSGRFPGIIEESAFAILAGQPLYLSRMLGGAAETVIDAICSRGPMPKDFAPINPPVRTAFNELQHRATPIPFKRKQETVPEPFPDTTTDATELWKIFQSKGLNGLCEQNGLSESENEQLFSAVTIQEAAALIVTGLQRKKVQHKPRRKR